MKLFNAKSQQLELFQPQNGSDITLYVCGISPAAAMRLGPVFICCLADVLVRYLELKGWRVQYGLQMTAEAEPVSAVEVQALEQFMETMQTLNGRPPDQFISQAADIPTHLAADLLLTYRQNTFDQVNVSKQQKTFARFGLDAPPEREPPTSPTQQSPVLVRDLLRRYSPDVLRIYLAQHHYQRPWTHDEVLLEKASRYAEKLHAAMTAVSSGEQPINLKPVQNRFTAVMDNDLDTRKGIATLLNLADEILFRAPNGYTVTAAQSTLQQLASVFGLRLDAEPVDETTNTGGWQALTLERQQAN